MLVSRRQNLVAGVAFCGLLLRGLLCHHKTRLRKRVADVPRRPLFTMTAWRPILRG